MIDVKEAIAVLKQFKEESQKHKDSYTPIGSNLSPVLKIMQDTYQENIDAFEMAIQAFEKQTPAKPMLILLQSGKEITACQKCECEIKHYQNYCLRCGQAIDWSKVQEIK